MLRSGRVAAIALSHAVTVCAFIPAAPAAAEAPQSLHGRVIVDSVQSRALGVWKHMVVYLPPEYDRLPRRRFSVAYYLHGWDGAETNWKTHGHLVESADSLAAVGKRQMIIVMPDADDSWYTTAAQLSDPSCAGDVKRKEPAAKYCVREARYDEYVAHDVVAHVDSTYRTRADARHRGIAGLSMGGYGAVTLALRHPRVFSAAASHSGTLAPLHQLPGGAPPADAGALQPAYGAIWPSLDRAFGRDTAVWWAHDPSRLATALRRRTKHFPALLVDAGADDPYLGQSRIFHDTLRHLGVPHEYHEWPGSHTWVYWRAHAAESLAWLAARIGA